MPAGLTGLFSGTAASTLTETSPSGTWTDCSPPVNRTPAELGYRMPAEWEPHRGTWLSWPHKEASWPGKFDPIPRIFAAMVGLLADREEVHINVAGPPMEAEVRRTLVD